MDNGYSEYLLYTKLLLPSLMINVVSSSPSCLSIKTDPLPADRLG